jgi:hypothetical protein
MLRHQLNVLRRRVPSKPKLATGDRLLFVLLYRLFPFVLSAAAIVQPETIIRWHRVGFRVYWRWKCRSRGGRPKVPMEISHATAARVDRSLVKAIVWARDLRRRVEREGASLDEPARHEGCSRPYVSSMIKLAYLGPSITQAIVAGTQPDSLTLLS